MISKASLQQAARRFRDRTALADTYALRWKVEVFHKILKSGCKVEESKLRTSERLVRLIALYCLIGWPIFWLTMLFRANPEQEAVFE